MTELKGQWVRRVAVVLAVLVALATGGAIRWRVVENYGIRDKMLLGNDGYMYYVSAAEAILEGRGLDPAYNHRNPPPPLYIPPPLQSVFIAAVYKACGNQLLINVYRAQAILGTLAGLFIFMILRRWAGLVAALAGLWLWMLYPEFIYWARLPMTEDNYLFLVILMLWALTRWAERPGVGWALAAAALIGLANLQRASAISLGIALAPAAWCWIRDRRGRWIQVAIFLLVPHLVLAPWMIRNWVKTGDPVWVNSNGGVLLYAVNHYGYDPLQYPDYMKYPDSLWVVPAVEKRFWSAEFDNHRTYYGYSRLYMIETIKYILAHPFYFLKNLAIKFVQRFVLLPHTEESVWMAHPWMTPRLFHLTFYGLLLAGVAGFVAAGRAAWRQPSRRVLAFCFGYYAAFHALMHWDGDGRIPLPLRLFLVLFAAVAFGRAAALVGSSVKWIRNRLSVRAVSR